MATRVRGTPAPLPRGPLGNRSALILPPENHKYSKNILRPFYPVWNPFDIGVFEKHKTCHKQELSLDQYVSPKNSIKICQKYVKVVEYWHGTIKNYRYDRDVSVLQSLESSGS